MMFMDKNFWQHKKLADFTEEEWEAVCMRCGKCCLTKSLEEDKICFSNQMCDGFDFKTGTCSRYKTRLGAFCVKVDMRLLQEEPELLPETCAYRLLYAGKELPSYHPLISGNLNSVHEARKTVLEIPEVYSITEFNDFLSQTVKSTYNTAISPQKRQEIIQKLSRYDVIFIEAYAIPTKP